MKLESTWYFLPILVKESIYFEGQCPEETYMFRVINKTDSLMSCIVPWMFLKLTKTSGQHQRLCLVFSHPKVTCSKSAMETPEQYVKSVQSQQ